MGPSSSSSASPSSTSERHQHEAKNGPCFSYGLPSPNSIDNKIKAIQGYTRVPAGDDEEVANETRCQVYRIVKKPAPSLAASNTTANRGVPSANSYTSGGRELRRSLSADSKLYEK